MILNWMDVFSGIILYNLNKEPPWSSQDAWKDMSEVPELQLCVQPLWLTPRQQPNSPASTPLLYL